MPTSTVQMPTRSIAYRMPMLSTLRFKSDRKAGFSLLEIIIVLGIVSLLTAIATLNFGSKVGKSSFKREAMELVNILKKAQNGSSQSGNRYAVMFDKTEQLYMLLEIRSINDLPTEDNPDPAEEIIIATTKLSKRCYFDFILFDDNTDTRYVEELGESPPKAYFIAGRSGWQNGGKIGLLDLEGNAYSIIINRMSKSIIFEEGDIDTYFLEPKVNLAF